MKQGFSKRIFTTRLFLSDLGFLIWNLPKLIQVLLIKKNPEQLFEKILLVTTAVYGCKYCAWLDTKMAISGGLDENEIKNMMELQFHTNATEFELNALLFAQNYAETNRNPEPAMTKKLFDYYGDKTAENILLAVRAETFGNLYFNTWEATISRFKGKPAPNSNVIFEIVYFLINSIIIIPFVLLRKMDKRAIELK